MQLGRVRSGRLAGKFVAVKRLNPEHEKDPQFVDMFLDEAWMTSAIKSPNVKAIVAFEPGSGFIFPQSELPQSMPSHLVVTQPGMPGPYDLRGWHGQRQR